MSNKIRKHNPKPNKVCIGQFLMGVNREIANKLKDDDTQLVKVQHGIMNYIFLNVTRQWCKCPWCIRYSNELLQLIDEASKSTDEPVEG